MVCPRCGSKYTANTSRNSKGALCAHYICGAYANGSGCARGSVPVAHADEAILAELRKRVPARFSVEELRAGMRKAVEREVGPQAERGPDPKVAELAAVERELAAIVANVSAENLGLFDRRLSALRERRDALTAAIAATTETEGPPPVDVNAMTEEALAVALELRGLLDGQGLTDPEDARDLRDVLPVFVKKIEAHPQDGVLLVWVYRVPNLTYGESGRRDSNSRSPGPHPGALDQAGPRPDGRGFTGDRKRRRCEVRGRARGGRGSRGGGRRRGRRRRAPGP